MIILKQFVTFWGEVEGFMATYRSCGIIREWKFGEIV